MCHRHCHTYLHASSHVFRCPHTCVPTNVSRVLTSLCLHALIYITRDLTYLHTCVTRTLTCLHTCITTSHAQYHHCCHTCLCMSLSPRLHPCSLPYLHQCLQMYNLRCPGPLGSAQSTRSTRLRPLGFVHSVRPTPWIPPPRLGSAPSK